MTAGRAMQGTARRLRADAWTGRFEAAASTPGARCPSFRAPRRAWGGACMFSRMTPCSPSAKNVPAMSWGPAYVPHAFDFLGPGRFETMNIHPGQPFDPGPTRTKGARGRKFIRIFLAHRRGWPS